jgi:hypothetical protein
MIIVIYIVIALVFGHLLALQRTGALARTFLSFSVLIGGFIGGYCGRGICLLILHLQGIDESRNNMPRILAALVFGSIFGSVIVPILVLTLTKSKSK